MGFWDLTDGDNAANGEKEYVQETGNFDPIPDNSNVLAEITEAKWDFARNNEEFLSLRWNVMSPEGYVNRNIFQKLWVTDDDPNVKDADKMAKKRDKAKRMLAAIDANAGGKLAKVSRKPDNDDLALALTQRPMIIKCMVWEKKQADGGTSTGNWISAVFPKDRGVDLPAPKPKGSSAKDDLSDSIPF